MKDHLGNVRSVIESRTLLIQEFLGSYEIASAAIEGLYFDNHNEIRDLNPATTDPDNEYSGRLNANEPDRKIGTSILTHVMAGDQIELNINSFYDGYSELADDPVTAEDIIQTLSSVLTAGEGGFEGSESHATDLVGMLFDDFNVSGLEDILENATDPSKPKAYLTYLFFDENMQLVPAASQSFQVEGDGTWGEIGTTQPVIMPQNGYLAVFLHTATTIADCHECANVFFDQLVFRVTRGNLKEEAHYYPHGLPIAGMGSVATGFKENRFKYQSNEMQKGLGLNWMNFHHRQYDPQIGRFLSVDPLAVATAGFSTYAGMNNNPANLVDPFGLQATSPTTRVNYNTGQTFFSLGERQVIPTIATDPYAPGGVAAWFFQVNVALSNNNLGSEQGMVESSKFDPTGLPGEPVSPEDVLGFDLVITATRLPKGGAEQQSNGGSGVDQTNWALSMGTLGLQASEGSFRLSTTKQGFSPKYYASGWRGNQYVNTYNISKIGVQASRGLVGIGVAVDFVRYRRGEISGKKFGFNSGMAAFGMTGVGTIPAAFYFGMEAFYPGGLEGAMNDNARYQKEVDAIMNTGNRGTHFYILPWGAQKL